MLKKKAEKLYRSDFAGAGRCGYCGHPMCQQCGRHRRLVFGADGFEEGGHIESRHLEAGNAGEVRFCSCGSPKFRV